MVSGLFCLVEVGEKYFLERDHFYRKLINYRFWNVVVNSAVDGDNCPGVGGVLIVLDENLGCLIGDCFVFS